MSQDLIKSLKPSAGNLSKQSIILIKILKRINHKYKDLKDSQAIYLQDFNQQSNKQQMLYQALRDKSNL